MHNNAVWTLKGELGTNGLARTSDRIWVYYARQIFPQCHSISEVMGTEFAHLLDFHFFCHFSMICTILGEGVMAAGIRVQILECISRAGMTGAEFNSCG